MLFYDFKPIDYQPVYLFLDQEGFYVFYALYILTTAIFNGMQKTLTSLKITMVKSVAFAIPLTLIGSMWGVNGIFIGLALSNVLAGVYASIEMRKEIRNNHVELNNTKVIEEYKGDFKRLFSRKKSN